MRMPWTKSITEQFDLVDEANAGLGEDLVSRIADEITDPRTRAATPALELGALAAEGFPLLIPVDCLEEDPGNPRTEFPDGEVAELAQDIAARGILQPIVVCRAAELVATASSSARSACVRPNGRGSKRSRSSSAQGPMTSTPKSPRTRSVMA